MIGGNAHSRRAEEFDAALSGRASGASRERYADLLDVVGAMRAVPAPVARAEFVADLRSQLLTAAADLPALPARRTDEATALRLTPSQGRGRRDRRVAALLGGFAVVAASGSMAVASQSALPGDALYPVKRAIENAHVNLETSPQAKASVLLSNASTRLTEVEKLSRRDHAGDTSEISSALQDFKNQASQASAVAIDDFSSNGDDTALDAVHTFASSSMSRLSALDDVLPTGARPALIAAAQTVRSVDSAAYDACPTCSDGLVTQLPSFATRSLSTHLTSSQKVQVSKTTTKPAGTKATTGPSSTTDPAAPQSGPTSGAPSGVTIPPVLPSPTATPHGGVVPDTVKKITDGLLGNGSSTGTASGGTSTDTSKSGGTSVVKTLTHLLGLD